MITRNHRTTARVILLALLALAPVACSRHHATTSDLFTVGITRASTNAVESLMRDEVNAHRIAGASVAILHGSDPTSVAWTRHFGHADIESGRPMDDDTIFRIASMSKPITSAAIMILYDRGSLDLDDPVSEYLPGFANASIAVPDDSPTGFHLVPAERPITIHHLLTHTAGITYRFWGHQPWADLYEQAGVSDGISQTPGTLEQGMDALARQPLMFEPGTAFEYGLNIDVLGRVIEVASGQPLDRFLEQNVFTPLGMHDTHFYLPPNKRNRIAALYHPRDLDAGDQTVERTGDDPVRNGTLVYSASFHVSGPTTYFSGGGGLASTLHDYTRFCRMILNRGTLEGTRILRPETIDLMASNQTGDIVLPEPWHFVHGDRFGYGFSVTTPDGMDPDDPAAPGTITWAGFYYTYFFIDRQNQLIGIMMTQLVPNDHMTLREDFKRAVYAGVN